MARQRSKKLSESRKATQQPAPVALDDAEEDFSDNDSSEPESEADDAELDRLVLGGGDFMTELSREVDIEGSSGGEEDLEEELGLGGEDEGLEGVDDADVSHCRWHTQNIC